jgi:hypothetical protein
MPAANSLTTVRRVGRRRSARPLAFHPALHGDDVVFPIAAVAAEGPDGDEVSGGGQPAKLRERNAEGVGGFGWSQ